jgi:Tfp pilus assembly major pilin PilA
VKTQIEKNMESLWRDMEEHAEKAMTEDNVTRLAVCHGAYKALCAVKGESVKEVKTLRITATNGDSDFESLLYSLPSDRAHMEAAAAILSEHMHVQKTINKNGYDSVMMKLREVARS